MSLNMSDELSCSTKLDGHIWTDLYAGVKSLTKNKQHLFESTI